NFTTALKLTIVATDVRILVKSLNNTFRNFAPYESLRIFRILSINQTKPKTVTTKPSIIAPKECMRMFPNHFAFAAMQ
ncbi:hypothetical protein IWQ49_006755, partial [Labrenzia sp. EL_126]|nr:hypothetical protein [Labrenzia sp. EL_126]